MDTTTLSKKYQVVIPKDVRKKMGLRSGETVSVHAIDNEKALIVKRPTDAIRALRGLGREVWRALGGTRRYLKNERSSWR